MLSLLYTLGIFMFRSGGVGALTPTKSSIYLKLDLASYSTEGGFGHPLYGGSCRLSMHTLASIHIVNTSFITHTSPTISKFYSHFISSHYPHITYSFPSSYIFYLSQTHSLLLLHMILAGADHRDATACGYCRLLCWLLSLVFIISSFRSWLTPSSNGANNTTKRKILRVPT